MSRHLGKTRLSYKHGTERNARGAVPGQLVNASKRTHTAAHVDRQPFDLADRANGGRVCGARGLVLLQCGGEVHHMQPLGTLRGKMLRHSHRVLGIHSHARAVAPLKTHHLAIDQVDRRKHDHCASPLSA